MPRRDSAVPADTVREMDAAGLGDKKRMKEEGMKDETSLFLSQKFFGG
jgi:hypothetical protein